MNFKKCLKKPMKKISRYEYWFLQNKLNFQINRESFQSYSWQIPRSFPNWPFFIKIKFTQTITAVVPQISYYYNLPQMREKRSLQYEKRLMANLPKTLKINKAALINTILKI